MKNNIFKIILIILGLTIIISRVFIFSFEFNNFDLFNYILKFGIIDIFALILIIIGVILKYNGISKNNKNLLWIILLNVGILPFVIILILSIINIFKGITFFNTICYGFEAFFSTILFISYLLWPMYIIEIALIIISIIKIIQNKKSI